MSDAIDRLNAALEGRYRIEREVGEGGMATVFIADCHSSIPARRSIGTSNRLNAALEGRKRVPIY